MTKYNLIKEKLLHLIEWTFERDCTLYFALFCNDRKAFFTMTDPRRYAIWSYKNVCDALSYLLYNINITFGTN